MKQIKTHYLTTDAARGIFLIAALKWQLCCLKARTQ